MGRRLLLRPYTSLMIWLGIEFRAESKSCQGFEVLFHFLLAPRVALQVPCRPAPGPFNVDAVLSPSPSQLDCHKHVPRDGCWMWHFEGYSSEPYSCVNALMTSVSLSGRPAVDLVACPRTGPGPVGFSGHLMFFMLIFSSFWEIS